MSSYAMCLGPCCCCKVLFSFNPHRVPSFRRTPESPREPICRACVEKANEIRVQKGLDPIVILDGAYNPLPAEEL